MNLSTHPIQLATASHNLCVWMCLQLYSEAADYFTTAEQYCLFYYHECGLGDHCLATLMVVEKPLTTDVQNFHDSLFTNTECKNSICELHKTKHNSKPLLISHQKLMDVSFQQKIICMR